MLYGLFEFEVWSVEEALMPYVEQLLLSNVSIIRWIINSYVYGLLDGPGKIVWFSTHNGEIFHTDLVTCDVSMAINRGASPKMLLMSFPKGPCRLSYILLITFQPAKPVPIDYSTFLCDAVLVLGGHKQVFDGVSTFKNKPGFPFGHKCFYNFNLIP